jgi:hypothetical protein
MGLSSVFVIIPPPSRLAHRANDCLPAGVDVHVLDGNFLLPLPAIALQCLGLGAKIRSNFVARFPLLSCSDTVSDPVKRRSARVAAKFVATAQSRVIGCRSTVFRSRVRALWYENYRFALQRGTKGAARTASMPKAATFQSRERMKGIPDI